jgi:predicted MPP superfamily phosphohydrolase
MSGHTHGSQVNIPLARRFVTPSHFGIRYAGGHVVEEGRHLFVSRGIGTSTLPGRFRALPEVSVLELMAP